MRAIASRIWNTVRAATWWALGLWTILAAYFTAIDRIWVALPLALGIAAFYFTSRREKFRLPEWPRLPWAAK